MGAAVPFWSASPKGSLYPFETLWYLSIRFLKMITSFLISMVFVLSITPSELAAGLYSIKVPYKICTIFSIAFRYIPDIGRDYENIKISMQARGVELDPKKSTPDGPHKAERAYTGSTDNFLL